MNAIIAKIASYSSDEIKKIITAMMDDPREEASVVLDAAMEALEAKIGTEAFCEFANAI